MNTQITQGVQSNRDIKRKAYIVGVCQHCESNYIIGITGTVMGCDQCLKVTRNPIDHTIIDDDEDTLTDMEKA
jgi:protein-arginine kinase activator protein McsA